ncbi:MAG: PKD domain-containing protein [Muribaculaceae bacterium]
MKKLIFGTLFAMAMMPAFAASPYLSRVLEYCPAPGQFINELPEYEQGDTRETMLAKVAENLCGEERPGMISLGGFGGYVIVGFDHPVVNVAGEYDFKLFGNAFAAESAAAGGSCEPGAVMVSVDANGNGLPDDEWWELAGSEYAKPTTKHGYEITYYRPADEHVADPDPTNSAITDRKYVRWTTNDADEAEGYIQKVTFHTQPYFPQWIDADELTFSGTRIPNNAELRNGTYFLSFMDYGYVDNRPNNSDPGFNIDWAVDAEGNHVQLSHIDFIKVYTAVNQQCGWIGETSTELSGGLDLHPDAAVEAVTSDDNALRVKVRGDEAEIIAASDCEAAIYSASGVMMQRLKLNAGTNSVALTKMPSGVYVLKTSHLAVKFLK